MGRAIDMEKDIDVLKKQVEKLENTVRGMVSKLDEIDDKAVKTKHIDIIEETKEEVDGKEKANNEGNGSDDGGSDAKNRNSKKKVNSNRTNSK